MDESLREKDIAKYEVYTYKEFNGNNILWSTKSFEAQDANDYINPEKVDKKAVSAKNTINDGIEYIKDQLYAIASGAGKDMLEISEWTIDQEIEEYANELGSEINISAIVDHYRAAARKIHDIKQAEYNETARDNAKIYSERNQPADWKRVR